MSSNECPENLNQEQKAQFFIDMLIRIIVHYSFWFSEIKHQMGTKEAGTILERATKNGFSIGLKRFSKVLGFEVQDGLPKALLDMTPQKLDALMKATAVNWLVNDGVWFQGVEFFHGMNDAKRCNDSCWAQFSPYEAQAVKKFLALSDDCGLDGLKKALNFRMYALINEQSIIDDGPDSFIFQMNDCRVQAARKRKNLDDYPCKSGGLVEYTYFARAIDQRIETLCIGCPPDDHPEEWYCAWRFTLKDAGKN